MDNSLDQKLLAFISSQSTLKPLSPSKSNNLPKTDIKSLESLCVASLDTLLNNNGVSNSNSSVLALDSLDAIEIRLRGLYLIYADDPRKSFDILRKHQLFIVKLFNLKQIHYVYQNLNVLFDEINKLFMIEPMSKSTIFTGIEFTDFSNWNDETSFFNANRKDISQLIVAFHFLILQWIAQYVSKNLKSILMQKDQVIGLDEFCNIPRMFLNSSNFRKWQLLSVNENLVKYNSNNVKLISGFIKVFQSIKASSSLLKYVNLTNCLRLKLCEFTKDKSLLKSIGFSSELIPFINDEDININEFIHRHVPEISEVSNELQAQLLESPHLISDSDFLRNLQNDLQLSIDKCQIIISAFNTFKYNLKSLLSQQLSILDLITIHLKDSLDESVIPILSQLFQIYNHFKLIKRMRNISNLLFNLGNKSNNDIYRNLAVDYECVIFEISPSNDNFKQFYNKLTRTQVATSVFGKVLVCFESYMGLTNNKDYDINGTLTQIICKTLLQISNYTPLNSIKDENFKFNVINDIFQFMEKSNNTTEKTKVCNSIIESTTWSNQLIECKIYYQYYNVNGLEKYLDLEEKSCDNQLITSGLQFQRLVTFGWNETLLIECLNNLKYGLNDNSAELDLFELKIIKQVLLYIKYNGMIDELVVIIEILLVKSIKHEQFEKFLLFEYARALLYQANNSTTNNDKFSQVFNDLKKLSQNWKSFDDIIELSLLQLQYFIHTKNSTKAKDRFNGILQTLLKKPQFNISKSKNLPIVSKLQNFLILGRFQLLACQINNHIIHNKIDAFNNIKTGIQLLYSIMKKLPTNIDKISWQELKWEITRLLFDSYKLAIDSSIDTGISRDIPLFLNEWVKLNNSIGNDIPIVNCINEFEIGQYGLLANNEFQKYIEIAENRLKHDLVGKNNTVKQYINRYHDDESKKFERNDIIWKQSSSSHQLKSLVRSILNSDNSLSDVLKSVQLLPCVVGESSTLCSKDLLDNLIQLKNETLMEITDSGKSRSLSLCQQQELIANMNQTVCLLSSLTSFRGDGLLSEIYYLQDYVRNLPFSNERKLMNSLKNDESNDLLPRALDLSQFDDPSNNNTIKSGGMIDFNVDLQLYLPNNWILVTLDICENTGDLLISKLTKGSPSPIFIRLPLLRFPSSLDFKQLMHNFEKIIDESNLSTKKKTTSKILTVEDRKQWWRSRFTLDYQLQDILHHVETKWFGGFISGIFTNNNNNNNNIENESNNGFIKFKQDLIKVLKDCLTVNDDKFNLEGFLQFNEFIYYCFHSMEEYNYELVDDLIKFIITNMNSHGKIVNSDNNVKINKLHESIKNLIIKNNKNKQNVVNNNCNSQHIVLIPNANCSNFPWESMDFLRNKSISRIPSIHMLLDLVKSKTNSKNKSMTVDKSNLYYLINPSGDLIRSENRFKKIFESNYLWRGKIGQLSTNRNENYQDLILCEILKSHLFVYIGHGGCDQYIKVSKLLKKCGNDQDSQNKLPPSLLLGCSSVKLDNCNYNYNSSKLQPLGNIYNWLNCKSAMILGNLWDVTDKDIDIFTISLLQKWGLINDSTNNNSNNNNNHGMKKLDLTNSVVQSRGKCTLKYLNGSAPVVYGLPMYLN